MCASTSSCHLVILSVPAWYQRRATIPQPPRCERGALPVELRWCGRIGRIRTSIACVSDRYTQPLCYDPLRRFCHRGHKGHGDALTFDTLSVFCGSALVGPKGFEPLSACYKQAALTVELQAKVWWVGRDSHPHSNAALLQSAGLARAQPTHLAGAATGIRTLTTCLEDRRALPLRNSSLVLPAGVEPATSRLRVGSSAS